MLVPKERVVSDLTKMFGSEAVVTDREAIKDYDADNNNLAKAFGCYLNPLPICVLNLASEEGIAAALKYCNDNGVSVIPRTGASSYEGLLTAVNDTTVVIDASAMNKVIKLDIDNMMVTCQCGVPLEALEKRLNAMGYTTGHAPQSIPVAQMGGLVATRSIGQFSTYYGGIEDMVCGLRAVMPNGDLVEIRNVPRRSAGPDLRHMFIGSEGALAFITEVTVKIFSFYPDDYWKGGYIMPDMDAGFKAIRDIIAAGFRPSVVRLYDKPDYDHNFGSIELEENQAFMFFVAEGPPAIAKATGDGVHEIAVKNGAYHIGSKAVEHWLIHRNDHCNTFGKPETRQKLRDLPIIYKTTEIAASHTDIVKIYNNVRNNVPKKIENLVLLGGHVSHAYQNGVNVYFVYRVKINSPETSEQEHQAVINAICDEVLKEETGGCVHHHGMGKQRVKFAPREHGSSYPLMVGLKQLMDPNGIMNPGALVAGPASGI